MEVVFAFCMFCHLLAEKSFRQMTKSCPDEDVEEAASLEEVKGFLLRNTEANYP